NIKWKSGVVPRWLARARPAEGKFSGSNGAKFGDREDWGKIWRTAQIQPVASGRLVSSRTRFTRRTGTAAIMGVRRGRSGGRRSDRLTDRDDAGHTSGLGRIDPAGGTGTVAPHAGARRSEELLRQRD